MNETKTEPVKQEELKEKPVDESLGFSFMSSLKITDLDTGEVLVQQRGD
jgi:hypothetical protein